MATVIVRDRLAFEVAYRLFIRGALDSSAIAKVPASSTAADGRTVFTGVPDALLPTLREPGIEYELVQP